MASVSEVDSNSGEIGGGLFLRITFAQVSNWYLKLPLTHCPYCTAFSPPWRCVLYTLVQPQSSNFGLSYRLLSNMVADKVV